jgi:hypothetical protein
MLVVQKTWRNLKALEDSDLIKFDNAIAVRAKHSVDKL